MKSKSRKKFSFFLFCSFVLFLFDGCRLFPVVQELTIKEESTEIDQTIFNLAIEEILYNEKFLDQKVACVIPPSGNPIDNCQVSMAKSCEVW